MTGIPDHVRDARERAELLVTPRHVQFAIDQVAVRMTTRLADEHPVLLCVLQGGFMYASELAKRFDFPLQVAFVHVARYGDRTEGGTLRWLTKPQLSVARRHVLLVDDILDQGITLTELVRWADESGARAVTTTVLVNKQVTRPTVTAADYAALECPDRYLFGCGMDYQGYWRNLPGIYALPEDLKDAS